MEQKGERMSDLISRQAAIKEIARWSGSGYIDEDIILRIQTGLKKLPLAQPERKTGRIAYMPYLSELWGQNAYCLSCDCQWQIDEGGEDNFCPNCGVRLTEGEDDDEN